MKKEKSPSQIATTIFIILLVLAAIVFVWQVVKIILIEPNFTIKNITKEECRNESFSFEEKHYFRDKYYYLIFEQVLNKDEICGAYFIEMHNKGKSLELLGDSCAVIDAEENIILEICEQVEVEHMKMGKSTYTKECLEKNPQILEENCECVEKSYECKKEEEEFCRLHEEKYGLEYSVEEFGESCREIWCDTICQKYKCGEDFVEVK